MGFEPTQLALVELESTPLDHSGKLSLSACVLKTRTRGCQCYAGGVLFGQAGHVQADRLYLQIHVRAHILRMGRREAQQQEGEREGEMCVSCVVVCRACGALEKEAD